MHESVNRVVSKTWDLWEMSSFLIFWILHPPYTQLVYRQLENSENSFCAFKKE